MQEAAPDIAAEASVNVQSVVAVHDEVPEAEPVELDEDVVPVLKLADAEEVVLTAATAATATLLEAYPVPLGMGAVPVGKAKPPDGAKLELACLCCFLAQRAPRPLHSIS